MIEKVNPSHPDKVADRIAGEVLADIVIVSQDKQLSDNQREFLKCGDNGIFKGAPLNKEQQLLSRIARELYDQFPTDGKYILTDKRLIICQSHARTEDIKKQYPNATINPLGEWTGGTDVDTGATNRKLGSDMADGVTGGGLHGKDLSKADVSLNIYAHLKAQQLQQPVELSCAIGDEFVDGIPYEDIVTIAKQYIDSIGGFEKFAEWGLF